MVREEDKLKSIEKINIKKHFEDRCIERIGKIISQEYMLNKLYKNELFFIKYCIEDNRTEYLFTFENKFYAVVYDLDYNLFVTIYPNTNRKCLYGEKYIINKKIK